MYARDAASRLLGIELEEVRPGYARLSMQVVDSMLNGHDVAHGGLIFTLADTAFAYACNSRSERNVALNAAISFTAAARSGDKLIAIATERSHAGRTGVYDVEVRSARDELVAVFRGTSYRISGSLT